MLTFPIYLQGVPENCLRSDVLTITFKPFTCWKSFTFFFFTSSIPLKWMLNHPSRINDSVAMKPTISTTKCWKWANPVENLLVKKPEYRKLQTKHTFFYTCTVCLWQAVHKPATRTKFLITRWENVPNFRN